MNTKELILVTALRLFNERGTDVITVRHIAAEMGISHGNLCYHFSNTDTIVSRLYDQLVERLSKRIQAVMTLETLSLPLLTALARQTLTTLAEYRFLMLDFAGVMRRLPELRDKHRALIGQRKGVFREILVQLRAQGLLRAELYSGHDEDLLDQFFIVGDFWLASATLLSDKTVAQQLAHYQRVFLALIAPLLTERGFAQWRALGEPM